MILNKCKIYSAIKNNKIFLSNILDCPLNNDIIVRIISTCNDNKYKVEVETNGGKKYEIIGIRDVTEFSTQLLLTDNSNNLHVITV